MSTMNLAPLFEACSLGSLHLKNRIAMSPMSRYRSPHGVPDANVVEYYSKRARSGIGLIVSEATYIDHPGASSYENVPLFFGDAALTGWGRVVDAVHSHGARMMPQLWHVGGERKLGLPPDRTVPGYGPSSVLVDGRTVVVAMTRDDIDAVVASYARSARYARELGFDGVAIHGAHGYLLDQFLWRETNRREDAYGGTLEKRARLAVEVVAAIRQAVGPGFPILFRFSQWKATDYDATIAATAEELGTMLRVLVGAGVDIFDVSARRFWQAAFPESPRSLAAWTRQLGGKPVMAVGSIGLDQPHQSKVFRTADNVAAKVTDLANVCEALVRGDFDLAGVGRAILADPMWVDKVRRGAFDAIVPFTRTSMDSYG